MHNKSYQINEKHGTYFFLNLFLILKRHADIKQQHDSMSRTVQAVFEIRPSNLYLLARKLQN